LTQFPGILPSLADALEKRGFAALTEVQAAVIAPELAGRDALVSAQTGSGKTVAFGLAIAPDLLGGRDRFDAAGAPLALAVAPTRELALQVRRELEWLYGESGAVVASCVGGMDMRTERRALERGAHIVVGTPGRLRDHITRNALDMSSLRAVVLDEADEMLDLGFRDDLEFILESAPGDRRTLMFSATVPRAIETLAARYQRDAVRLATAGETKQHGDIAYRALMVAASDRENAIINVLRYYEAANALVFCSTRAAVNHLAARFNNRGFSAVSLSGELSQSERTHALQAMRDGRARVCIATDVAARGIDLPNLELVVHADLPTNPETLLHRSGRTGRAGRKGVSVLIVPTSAHRRAERLLHNAAIAAEWARAPSAEEVTARDDERLLSDPLLAEAAQEDEQALVQALMARHAPEQIAAAFIRRHRAGKSAPEDLIEVNIGVPGAMRGRREDAWPNPRAEFGESIWISLSVGRRQNAEPRWLIPMLCRVGKITKREIGAIRMQTHETFVQIAAEAAEGFWKAVGPDREVQDGIRLSPVDGVPQMSRQGQERPEPAKPYAKRKDGPAKSGYKPAKRASGEDRPPRPDERARPAGWAKPGGKGKKKFDTRGEGASGQPARPKFKGKKGRTPDA